MPHLETDRLILRIPTLDDLGRWAEMMADADAARFIGGVSAKPVVWRMIMQMNGAWAVTGVSMFSVLEKSTGRWLGRVGPWQPYGWPGTEVGWGLHPGAWGKRYAVEAATATMDYAFDVLGWTNVVHCINSENRRTISPRDEPKTDRRCELDRCLEQVVVAALRTRL